MNTIRDYMFRRFGAGKPDALTERVRLYLLGMPDSNGVPFPPRVDIECARWICGIAMRTGRKKP